MNLYQLSEIDQISEHTNMLRAHLGNIHPLKITHQKQLPSLVDLKTPKQIENEVQTYLLTGNEVECIRLIEQLPGLCFASSPILHIYRALAMIYTGSEIQEINDLLSSLEESEADQDLSGEITAVKALLKSYSGDQNQAIKLSLKAMSAIPYQNYFFRQLLERNLGMAYSVKGELRQAARWFEALLLSSSKLRDQNGILAAYNSLTYIRMVQGRLNEAGVIFKKALTFIRDNDLQSLPHAIKILAGYGHLCMQRHELEQAKTYLRQSIQYAKLSDTLLAQKAYQDLSEVFIRERDLRSALANIQECRQRLQRKNNGYYQLINQLLLANEARIHLEAGRFDKAKNWLTSSGFEEIPAQELYFKQGDQLGYTLPIAVRIYLEADQTEKALTILNATLPKYLHAGANTYLIRGLTALAITYNKIGDVTKAIKALLKAIDLAKREDNLGDFIFLGQDLMPLLYEIVESGVETEFCGKLLSIFSSYSKRESASENLLNTIDPLSNRELDVLHLIAKGMTNREIACTLFLSANTIKSHSIKIYRKLNVNNRSQAVSKARLLGIIPTKMAAPFQPST